MPLPAETANNTAFASAARTASSNSADIDVRPYLGCKVVIDMTVVPGVDTVTFTVKGKDKLSGKYFTLLASAAIVAVSTVVLSIYPGAPVTANVSVNDFLPDTIRVEAVHSAATSFTYSVNVIAAD